jgi:inosine-uridine nucleoside N-ribohydrolase
MDTDTFNEIDDQFAIAQMMLSPERFDVEAIYAAPFFINGRSTGPADGMEKSYDEILRLLERLNISDKGLVHKGVREYVGPEKHAREAPAVDDLISRARSATPEAPLYVIAIAAISNIASAMIKAPDIADRTVVVWLGGHGLEWPHTREFNLRQDVGGAQLLFDSAVPLVWVPCLGVTSDLHSTVPEIERYVEPCGAIGAFLAMRFKEYSHVHKGWSKRIWDMAPVGWLLDSDWAPSVLTSAPMLSDQMTWSRDHRRHQIRYVNGINRDAMFQDLIRKLERFAGLPSCTEPAIHTESSDQLEPERY